MSARPAASGERGQPARARRRGSPALPGNRALRTPARRDRRHPDVALAAGPARDPFGAGSEVAAVQQEDAFAARVPRRARRRGGRSGTRGRRGRPARRRPRRRAPPPGQATGAPPRRSAPPRRVRPAHRRGRTRARPGTRGGARPSRRPGHRGGCSRRGRTEPRARRSRFAVEPVEEIRLERPAPVPPDREGPRCDGPRRARPAPCRPRPPARPGRHGRTPPRCIRSRSRGRGCAAPDHRRSRDGSLPR